MLFRSQKTNCFALGAKQAVIKIQMIETDSAVSGRDRCVGYGGGYWSSATGIAKQSLQRELIWVWAALFKKFREWHQQSEQCIHYA